MIDRVPTFLHPIRYPQLSLWKKTGLIVPGENLQRMPMGRKMIGSIHLLTAAVTALSLINPTQVLAQQNSANLGTIQKSASGIVPRHGVQPNNPEQALVYYRQGVALQQQGQLEAAIAQYQAAIRLNPNLAEAHLNLGVALAVQGKLPEAIASYQEAIGANPNLAEAHHNLGNALAQQGKLAEAIEQYQLAIEINPNYAKAHYNLGNVLVRQGERNQAIAQWRQAIQLNPEFAEAYANLGLVLNRQGQRREGTEALKKARDLFKSQGKTQQAEQIERILQRLGGGTTAIT